MKIMYSKEELEKIIATAIAESKIDKRTTLSTTIHNGEDEYVVTEEMALMYKEIIFDANSRTEEGEVNINCFNDTEITIIIKNLNTLNLFIYVQYKPNISSSQGQKAMFNRYDYDKEYVAGISGNSDNDYNYIGFTQQDGAQPYIVTLSNKEMRYTYSYVS